MNNWIDPKDKLPSNNERIMILMKGDFMNYVTMGAYSNDPVLTYTLMDKTGKPVWYDFLTQCYTYCEPLYWMKLPEPPNEKL